jgi:hypothetical protein
VRIQIEPTELVMDLNGMQTRVWNGITDSGVQVFVFVHRVAIHSTDDPTAFERELIAMPLIRAVPIKQLLDEVVESPSITCPVCGMTSYNANDVRHGWCGNCRKQTSPV